MKSLICIVPVLLLSIVAKAQYPPAPDGYVKMLDFRDEIRSPELDRKALSQDFLDRLFAAAYPNGDESLESEMHAVRGSFSKPGNQEIVVVFTSSNNGHAGLHGNLMLMEGNRVKTWVNEGYHEKIEGVVDLDQDGLQEVLTSYTDGGQGLFHTEVETLTFKGGVITVSNAPYAINTTVEKEDCRREDTYIYTSGFYFDGADLKQLNYSQTCGSDTYEYYSEGIIVPNDWDHDGIGDDDGG